MTEMIELYKQGLLKGIIESRTKHITRLTSLSNATIYPDTYKAIRRGTRWILTQAGVSAKVSDETLLAILKDLGVNVEGL